MSTAEDVAGAVSFLASDQAGDGVARLVRGVYQSPILIQWRPAPRQTRKLDVSIIALE